MRELTVRIKFTSPCLGNAKKFHNIRVQGKRKKRTYFVHLRNPSNCVMFLPTWWQAIMRNAADVLSRHQQEVKGIRFALEVDGQPRPIPEQLFNRYYDENRYSRHEAFMAGDTIGVTCVVPDQISDDDFWRLMQYAGKFYGISPCRPGEFGFFTVEKMEKCGLEPPTQQARDQNDLTEVAQSARPME